MNARYQSSNLAMNVFHEVGDCRASQCQINPKRHRSISPVLPTEILSQRSTAEGCSKRLKAPFDDVNLGQEPFERRLRKYFYPVFGEFVIREHESAIPFHYDFVDIKPSVVKGDQRQFDKRFRFAHVSVELTVEVKRLFPNFARKQLMPSSKSSDYAVRSISRRFSRHSAHANGGLPDHFQVRNHVCGGSRNTIHLRPRTHGLECSLLPHESLVLGPDFSSESLFAREEEYCSCRTDYSDDVRPISGARHLCFRLITDRTPVKESKIYRSPDREYRTDSCDKPTGKNQPVDSHSRSRSLISSIKPRGLALVERTA